MVKMKKILLIGMLMNCAAMSAQIVTPNTTTQIDSTIIADKEMEHTIELYADSLASKMNEIIGEASSTMIAKRPESELMRLLSDILLQVAHEYAETHDSIPFADMSVVNVGGIRTSLNEGNITVGNILEISPFENTIVIVEMNGMTLHEMMKHIVARGGEAISNAEINIIDNQLTLALVDNTSIDPNAIYYVATLDYIAEGGDSFSMLSSQKRYNTNILFHDAIIKYIRDLNSKGEKIVAPTNTRVRVISFF